MWRPKCADAFNLSKEHVKGILMSLIKEFREFAVKGNMVDMAVGVIIGTAFGKIVSSLVADIVMPPIGMLLGGVDFTELAWVIQEAAGETTAVAINYGKFIQTLIDFLIIALTVFMAIKLINRLRRNKEQQKTAEAPAALSKQEMLLTEIRDLLKK
jgi:large conductance mechanosensitive channel